MVTALAAMPDGKKARRSSGRRRRSEPGPAFAGLAGKSCSSH